MGQGHLSGGGVDMYNSFHGPEVTYLYEHENN